MISSRCPSLVNDYPINRMTDTAHPKDNRKPYWKGEINDQLGAPTNQGRAEERTMQTQDCHLTARTGRHSKPQERTPSGPAAAEVIDMRWRMPSTFPRNGEWVETKFVTLSRTGEDGQEEEMTLRMWRPICPDSGGCDLE